MPRCSTCLRLTRNPRYCSRRCAAIRNNHLFPKRHPSGRCKRCRKPLALNRRICTVCRSRMDAWRARGNPLLNMSLDADDRKFALDLIGLALWWAEGSKNRWRIAVTNSDPDVILLTLSWLREVYSVPMRKFRAHIHVHRDIGARAALRFWRRLTGIPRNQFYKTHVKPGASRIREGRLAYGTCTLYVFDTKLFDEFRSKLDQLRRLPRLRGSIGGLRPRSSRGYLGSERPGAVAFQRQGRFETFKMEHGVGRSG